MIKNYNRILKDSEVIIARLSKRKNEYGEYVIKGYVDGERNENYDYFTDDWEDAVGTAKFLAKQNKGELVKNANGYVIYSGSSKKSVKDSAWDKLFQILDVEVDGEWEGDFKVIARDQKEALDKVSKRLKGKISYGEIYEDDWARLLKSFDPDIL